MASFVKPAFLRGLSYHWSKHLTLNQRLRYTHIFIFIMIYLHHLYHVNSFALTLRDNQIYILSQSYQNAEEKSYHPMNSVDKNNQQYGWTQLIMIQRFCVSFILVDLSITLLCNMGYLGCTLKCIKLDI